MSKGFDMLRDYIEHDALCMRRRKCCDFEYELQQEFAALEAENAKLRELVNELYQCSRQEGCDHCGYKDGCCMFDRMAQMGIEVTA